jgi:hypothetical protein
MGYPPVSEITVPLIFMFCAAILLAGNTSKIIKKNERKPLNFLIETTILNISDSNLLKY